MATEIPPPAQAWVCVTPQGFLWAHEFLEPWLLPQPVLLRSHRVLKLATALSLSPWHGRQQ